LGGTSNHFRTASLRAAGGWDAFNVTEDADLGFRLARLGHTTDTLDSITYEEASSTPSNWLKQRSRWLKGFLVTWLVHMRNPARTFAELGIQGSLILHAVLLGVMAAAVVHPIFLGLALWKFTQSSIATQGLQAVLDAYFFALFPVSWAIMLLTGRKALHRMGIRGWWFPLLTMPCYWLCISLASYMALWEFFTARSHWNKTRHGLSRLMAQPKKLRQS
jgi:cellulose synthase/poly-beta-1,6-N-acetylglucosamine synthase-like glycosyltransferase